MPPTVTIKVGDDVVVRATGIHEALLPDGPSVDVEITIEHGGETLTTRTALTRDELSISGGDLMRRGDVGNNLDVTVAVIRAARQAWDARDRKDEE